MVYACQTSCSIIWKLVESETYVCIQLLQLCQKGRRALLTWPPAQGLDFVVSAALIHPKPSSVLGQDLISTMTAGLWHGRARWNHRAWLHLGRPRCYLLGQMTHFESTNLSACRQRLTHRYMTSHFVTTLSTADFDTMLKSVSKKLIALISIAKHRWHFIRGVTVQWRSDWL